jgi:hypothetical protein
MSEVDGSNRLRADGNSREAIRVFKEVIIGKRKAQVFPEP